VKIRTRSDWAKEFYQEYFTEDELEPNAEGECPVSCVFSNHGKGRGDKSKSMSVNITTGEYNCMAPTCKGGTEFDFYCQMNEIESSKKNILRVKKVLEEKLGERPDSVTGGTDGSVEQDDKFIDIDEVEFRQKRLLDKYPKELEFLKFMRGLDEATIKQFRLGYKPAEDRISIPIFDEHGRCVNIRGYSRHDPLNKINSYGAGYGKGRLFPIENLFSEEKDILLCEGEFDAILANQMGYNAVTATIGAGNWKGRWNNLFSRKNVYICYDNDEAGKLGAEKVGKQLIKKARKVKIIDLGQKMDINGGDITDFFVELGKTKEDFDELLSKSKDFSGLEYNDKGQLIKSEHNVEIILTTGAFEDKFYYNEFSGMEMIHGDLPWRDNDGFSQWTDSDDSNLRHYIGINFGIRNIITMLEDAITTIAFSNMYHPIKNFIETEQWDGSKRLSGTFINWLGAEDNSYNRKVAEMSLVAAVARIYKPGIKYDYMPVLVGEQGIGKSYMFEVLTEHKWFSILSDFGGKDTYEKLQESWIFEVAELEAFKKSEEREIKSFITTTNDKFRSSYGRRVEEHPRTCVFFGTTNENEFLKDSTGNRRFLPIICNNKQGKSPDLRKLEVLVEQYWAEALYLWKSGYKLELPAQEAKMALEMQEDQYSSDPWEDIIEQHLMKNDMDEISIPEIWFKILGGDGTKVARFQTERIKKCLDRLDWKKGKRKRTDFGLVSVYERKRLYEVE